jgi:hypothetical protein
MNRDFKNRVPNDETLSRVLRSLPRRIPPANLRSQLRGLASREQRRALGIGAGVGLAFGDRARLFAENLMRPLALPFAGGVFSTVLAFSMLWLGTGSAVHASNGFDIPIPPSIRSQAAVLTSDPTILKTAPMHVYGVDDVIVDVTVDGQGRMIDYTIVSGNVAKNEAVRSSVSAVLLLTEFHPATTLGRPVAGRVRLSLSVSHSKIDVKG